ncbi:serine hydroxymethyltransferase [Streptomyces sp. NPDC059402]|uniref:serine hydroxymethyltransferase n=1 Tax=Streptomyces sp. NPDC059402 TaxID=3346822 RepID=UPI0036C6767D
MDWETGAGRMRPAFEDDAVFALLAEEERRQRDTLQMVAAASTAPWQVLWCNGSVLTNVTGEGYPGRRYHSGCGVFDRLEELACRRARDVFGASFANVQPHSGTNANLAALRALLPRGGKVLSMSLKAGGHLSHGARASVTSTLYGVHHYGVTRDGLIDLEEVRTLALGLRPDVVICGGSAYPRELDFAAFRKIADEAGAALLADVSHVAGLVAAGLHPSPVPYAHLVTTSTYKQLAGPRGGLVLGGTNVPDPGELERRVGAAVFPGVQGSPAPHSIAAKAWAFGHVATPDFHAMCRRIVTAARAVAEVFADHGYALVGSGTDTHMVLADLRGTGTTGWVAEKALESCGVLVNRNVVPEDTLQAAVAGGLRIGTNTLAARGGDAAHARRAAELIVGVLESVESHGPTSYTLPPAARALARRRVAEICGELEDVPAGPPSPTRTNVQEVMQP